MLSRKTESRLTFLGGSEINRLSSSLKDIFVPSRVQLLGFIAAVLAFGIGYSIASVGNNSLQSHLEAEVNEVNSRLESLRSNLIAKDSELSDLKAYLSDVNSTLQSKTLLLSDAERLLSNIQRDLSVYNKTISISASGTEFSGLPYETIRKLTVFLTWRATDGWHGFGFYTEKFANTNRVFIIDVIRIEETKVVGVNVELIGTVFLTTREDLLLNKEVIITASDKGFGFRVEEVVLQFPTLDPPRTIMLRGPVEFEI